MPYKDPELRKDHSRAYYFFNREKILKYKFHRYWYMTREERKAYQREYYSRNHKTINALRRLSNDILAIMWADILCEGITGPDERISYDLGTTAREVLVNRSIDPEILLRRRKRANYLPCHRTHRPPGL